MQYTDYYNLKLPDSSDAVRVDDFNDNSEIIDAALKNTEISAVTAAEIWGAGNAPSNITIDGAFSQIAVTVPATMGTAGKVLTAGSGGAYWGSNPMYKELVGESTVSTTGVLQSLCSLPTGWRTDNLVGLYLEGTMTLVGAYNNGESSREIVLRFGEEPIASAYFTNDEDESYDETAVQQLSFNATFLGVGGTASTLAVGYRCIGTGSFYFETVNATTLTVSNSVVTGVGSNIGFFYYSSGNYKPYAKSCTGTIKLYAIREVT